MDKVNQDKKKLITRRNFLVGIVIAIVIGLLSACAPKIIEKTTELPVTTLAAITPTLPTSASTTLTTSPTTTTTTKMTITGISLPVPINTEISVETVLNSRFSYSGVDALVSPADIQQLSNVLWAVGKAPMVGPTRKITIATQAGTFGPGTGGTYSYNPDTHSLTKISGNLTDQGAFKISWDIGQNGLIFDAGLIYMPALLASDSLWNTTESLVSSPKQLDIVFGRQNGIEFNTQCVAHSTVQQGQPGWLPDPSTTGSDKLGDVLANLNYTNKFNQANLTLQQISQLLWAGYGCTPHGDTKGITTPSAYDSLYLTGTIYLVNENGVFRYQNRQPTDNFFTHPEDPSNFFNTRDHRLEQISSSDVRDTLRSAVSGLSQAPCYIVLSLDRKYDDDATTTIKTYANLETGFVAFNYLLQASAMGLGCNLKTQLTSNEQGSIQSITKIPTADKPLVVVSLGGMGN